LVGQADERRVQILERARRRRQLGRRLREVELRARRVRKEVERDIELPGQEASRAQLRAQAALDQRADELLIPGEALAFRRAAAQPRGEALRVDADLHRDGDLLAL